MPRVGGRSCSFARLCFGVLDLWRACGRGFTLAGVTRSPLTDLCAFALRVESVSCAADLLALDPSARYFLLAKMPAAMIKQTPMKPSRSGRASPAKKPIIIAKKISV